MLLLPFLNLKKMKKTQLILLAIIMVSVFSSSVFSQAFDDGTNLLSIGFGVPPSDRIEKDFNRKYYYGYNGNNVIYDYKFNNYGTGVLKFEHGLHKYFGLGLNLEYSGASASYKSGLSPVVFERNIKNNVIAGYVRFNGHFPIGEKLDLYGGVGLGYRYSLYKISDSYTDATLNKKQKETFFEFDYQVTIGARFMVKDNIGLFIEAGLATTPAQIGIVFKF